MRTVIGFEPAKKLLLENRGLNLSDTAGSISEFSEKIFGRKMTALQYVERIVDEVRVRGDAVSYTHLTLPTILLV